MLTKRKTRPPWRRELYTDDLLNLNGDAPKK